MVCPHWKTYKDFHFQIEVDFTYIMISGRKSECTKVQNSATPLFKIFMALATILCMLTFCRKMADCTYGFNGGSAGSSQQCCFWEPPHIFDLHCPLSTWQYFQDERTLQRWDVWLYRQTHRPNYSNPPVHAHRGLTTSIQRLVDLWSKIHVHVCVRSNMLYTLCHVFSIFSLSVPPTP